jgi:gamma-glutamyltranspeptidase/glutathione hydrolase
LAQGGNAFDAAAAIGAMLNVVEPFMSGLAGLGLATMWVEAEKRVRVLDFVPAVPSSFTLERFNGREDLERGALAVSPPCNFAGWCTLAKTYGHLALPTLLAPAIAIAADGFPLLEFGVSEFVEQAKVMAGYPKLYRDWASCYATEAAPRVGTVIRQPHLAKTLTILGEQGGSYLYSGALGEQIVAHIAAGGGNLTMDDLRAFQPVWKEPVAASYRGLLVHVPPPPSEGFQILLALRLLEAIDFSALQRDAVDHINMVCRAIRLAAGIRIANTNPSPETMHEMFSDFAIASAQRRLLDGIPIEGPTEQGMPKPEKVATPFHTTSFSVADREGNLICVTQSLGSAFGSGVVVPGTGVCLNNFLQRADIQHDSPNVTRVGGVLPTPMAPSITLRDGSPVLALGTPGSYGILQSQVQAMVQYIDYGVPLQHAIEAPRVRLTDGRTVTLEDRIGDPVIEALRDRGHDARTFGVGWTAKVGGMQAVALDPATSVMTGAADPRRDGHVAVP